MSFNYVDLPQKSYFFLRKIPLQLVSRPLHTTNETTFAQKMICENHWPNMNLINLSYGMEGLYKFIVKAYHRGLLLEGGELPSCHFYCICELCCHSHKIQTVTS